MYTIQIKEFLLNEPFWRRIFQRRFLSGAFMDGRWSWIITRTRLIIRYRATVTLRSPKPIIGPLAHNANYNLNKAKFEVIVYLGVVSSSLSFSDGIEASIIGQSQISSFFYGTCVIWFRIKLITEQRKKCPDNIFLNYLELKCQNIIHYFSPRQVIWSNIRCLDFIFPEPGTRSWNNIFVILQILYKTAF